MAERIDTAERFEDTPAGWHKRWLIELQAARENLEESRERGQESIDRFLDVRDGNATSRRLNLHTSNVQTLRAVLYGKVPKATVRRRFGDARDDVARVAGEILERCLNSDIERDGDGFREALGSALDDRLLSGIGQIRCRYTVEMEEREVPPKMGPAPMPPEMLATMDPASLAMAQSMAPQVELAPGYVETVKAFEDAETDYTYWRDFLYAPCRTWGECRWVAFGVPMTRADLIARFGDDLGNSIPLDVGTNYNDAAKEQRIDDVWGRACIWEIWDKARRVVEWVCEGYPAVLDSKPDTLGLEGFFPCPRPLFANVTSDGLIPIPDYYFARDQYREVDSLESRIAMLREAIAVKGVGDVGSDGLKALLDGKRNEVVLISNYAMFAEAGGVKGAVQWFPLDMVVSTLRELEAQQDRIIQMLYQLTGLGDIIRGQAQPGKSTTATEQSIKARFASVRLQSLQDEVARFASDAQKIRAEIIAKHFDDATILERANFVGGQDQELIAPALKLLRDRFSDYRIEIAPENINLQDAASLKSERMEALQMVGGFLSNTAQLAQANPKAAPMLTEMLTWAFAGFKGASTIEGSLDRYAAQQQEQAMQPRPQLPPPQVMVAQMKGKQEQDKIAMKAQADIAVEQAKTQGAVTVQTAQAKADLITQRADEDAQIRAEERELGRRAVEAVTQMGGLI